METGSELNALGTVCPEPLRLASEQLRQMAPGALLHVLADDPAAPIDFEVWCLRQGHDLVTCLEQEQGWRITLRKGPDRQ